MLGRVGPLELVIILIIVILIFGPSRLPKIAKAAGETLRQFRQVRRDVDETVDDVRQAGRTVTDTIKES